MNAILETALAAYDAGACPIRGMTDGSKRPLGNWSEWQNHRPTRSQIQDWFQNGHPALGIVCGEISGRLECLEIEGQAMDVWKPLRERLGQAGFLDLLIEVTAGYAERSPARGVHFIYRIGGESELPGNTKLASRPLSGTVQVQTMIETRGEGGFIIVAPSNGPTHPTGEPWVMLSGGWDSVRTITREQRDEVVRICESFDEMPPMVVPPAPRRKVTPTAGGSGWVDTALAEWDQANPIEAVLQRNGWQYLESDGLGQLWRRPGKDRGSCSARVNLNNRLHVFSTSTPFIAGQRHATTYDSLDVELTYRLGRPPSSDERVAYLRDNTTAAPSDDYSWVTVTDRPAVAPPASHSADGAASTAGVQHQEVVEKSVAGPNIPREFWLQRPWLTQIRDAAHSRLRSPDGLLGAYLARYATTIPKTLMLPAIVGSEATFDYMSMLVAPSGGGKSSTIALAARLMDNYPPNPRFLFDPPIGSGEGLVQAFLRLEKIKIDDKDVWVQRQILDAIHFSVDEGSALTAQSKRDGTMIVPTLCTAWSGGPLGQLGAKIETRRELKRYEYRVTAVMGIQTALADQLTALANTGLPQRMMWFSLVDPHLPPPGTVDWPGELDVAYLNPHHWSARHAIQVHPSIMEEVQDYEHSLINTSRTVDLLDSQRYMLMLKNAGIFMFIDDRRTMSPEDWELARTAVDSSRQVRNTILEAAIITRRQKTDLTTAAKVGEMLATEDALRARAIRNGARAMGNEVVQAEGPVKIGRLSRAVAGRNKKLATPVEMLDYAISLHWVVDNGDGTFSPGDARPA